MQRLDSRHDLAARHQHRDERRLPRELVLALRFCFMNALELPAPVRNFARNCALEAREGEHWTLALSPRFEALYRESHLDDLARAIGERLGGRVQLKLKQHEPATPTPDQLLAAHQQQRKAQAVARMQEDQLVRDLQQLFNATLDIDSVTPVDDQ